MANTIIMTNFSYYSANIKDAKPLGIVSLKEFLRAIREPKPDMKIKFEAIQAADLSGDETEKARIKQSLYSFTPATICTGKRKYDNIKHFTGLLVLDFDKFDTHEDALYFKEIIQMDYNYIMAAWLSASGRGVRALVDIPICRSVEDYKAYFNGIRFGTDMGLVKNFDIAPQNPVLPLFMSFDPDIYYNEYAKTFTDKYEVQAPPPVDVPLIDYDKEHDIKGMIEKSLSKITDAGHHILRATAYAVGGHVGAGHISRIDAEALMDWAIDNHSYLCKKASTYKTTAHTMINQGQLKPLE